MGIGESPRHVGLICVILVVVLEYAFAVNPFVTELICEKLTFFDMTPNGVTGNERVKSATGVAYLL